MAIFDLTFTDWENYTDGDGNAFVLDWASVEAMRGKSPFPYIDALRQACLERSEVTNSQGSLIFDATTNPRLNMSSFGSGELWTREMLTNIVHWLRAESFYVGWIDSSAYKTLGDAIGNISDQYTSTEQYDDAEKRLDAAGITSQDFRDYWVGVNPIIPCPLTEVVLNCKKMLSTLTAFYTLRDPLKSHYSSWKASEVYVLPDDPVYPYTLAGAYAKGVAEFNAGTWSGWSGPYTRPGAINAGHNIWLRDRSSYGYYRCAIYRTRLKFTVDLKADGKKRDWELLLPLGFGENWLGAGWNLPSPGFSVDDYPSLPIIPGVCPPPDPNDYRVYMKLNGASDDNGGDIESTIGDFSGVTIPMSDAVNGGACLGWAATDIAGWAISEENPWYSSYVVQQNFDVTDGFTFRETPVP